MNDLLWFGVKAGVDFGDLYEVQWVNKDGKNRVEYFTTRERAKIIWGDICGGLSYVHIWIKPDMGVRAFLQYLPLDLVDIIKV